jgi:hypothetical protein
MTVLGILGIDWYEFENFMQLWAPILLMGVLVYLVWRTLKLMPRQITPRSASSVTWEDIAERLLTSEVIEHEEIRAIMDSDRLRAEPVAEDTAPADQPATAGDRAAALASKPPEPERR